MCMQDLQQMCIYICVCVCEEDLYYCIYTVMCVLYNICKDGRTAHRSHTQFKRSYLTSIHISRLEAHIFSCGNALKAFLCVSSARAAGARHFRRWPFRPKGNVRAMTFSRCKTA